ncbi:hypothetical protein N3K66_003408 [Trichothecium roseum]|uniref:Uncharacterized protein n=1 Tax=Trichothecium roseum TaxID=47278 RepID=A0ACC0V5D1_9HYPO|nr:hypothetical protein N3K66_003408 [Trichothecium roseum]
MCQSDGKESADLQHRIQQIRNEQRQEEPFPWHLGAFDAHCHPTDTMASIASIPQMKARTLTIMGTRSQDQHLVAQVADDKGIKGRKCLAGDDTQAPKVVPSFGWHPWFSHQLFDDSATQPTYMPGSEDAAGVYAAKKAHYQAVLTPSPDDDFVRALPEPTPISVYLSRTREYLRTYPLALVGEIGVDKAFRLPEAFPESHSHDSDITPGGREGRRLSPHRVKMTHQQAILKAQLGLAGDVGRAVSVHGVQAHGVLHDTIQATWKGRERVVRSARERKRVAPGAEESSDEDETVGGRPYPPRICLHSFSGSVEVMEQWLKPVIPAVIFFSFSVAVNLGTESATSKFEDVVRAMPDNKILVESDLHTAGTEMDDTLEDMCRRICRIKSWSLEEGLGKIGDNYKAFILGSEPRLP